MTDRRAHDPFAPAPATTTTGGPLFAMSSRETSTVRGAGTWAPDDEQPDDGLGLLRRVELVQIAEREGVSAYGNRDALLARIRSHRADRQS